MTTILFVGAGRHQRRAIRRARELGLRVVAVDGSADAAALGEADAAAVVDFTDIEALAAVGRHHRVEGVLTVSADRAVPVVAAVAEALGLPGIGVETAHAMTHKVAMRRRLADAGVPQPRFAAVRTLNEARAAARTVGFPAVLKPADSGGQRGIFRLDSLDDLERHLHATLAESHTGEAIVEQFQDGIELNGLVLARNGVASVLTLSDRMRPPGPGFGVGWIHVYPPTLVWDTLAEAERVAVHAVHALGLRNGIAFPQLIATATGEVSVVEVAARIPGGQMADLCRHATGVELIDIVLRQALGEEVPDELGLPRFSQPLAIRFLTAEPGPLRAGRVVRIGSLDRALAAPGVVQAELYFGVGDTIRPVQVDADRMGYVIAIANSNLEALDRAEAAAALVDVEVEVEPAATARGVVPASASADCPFDLDHYVELLDAARAGGYRIALFDAPPRSGDLLLRHDVDLSLEAAVAMAELEARLGIRSTYFVMTASVFYNLASPVGERALARLRELGHVIGLHADWPQVDLDGRFAPLVSWHNPEPHYMTTPLDGALNVMQPPWFQQDRYRSDSNQRWRHGCPHDELRRGVFDWLHLNIHPSIWVYPGETMRETMLAMVDAERARRIEQLLEDRVEL